MRYGSIHRNRPSIPGVAERSLLRDDAQVRARAAHGVEGYTKAARRGVLAGIISAPGWGEDQVIPPPKRGRCAISIRREASRATSPMKATSAARRAARGRAGQAEEARMMRAGERDSGRRMVSRSRNDDLKVGLALAPGPLNEFMTIGQGTRVSPNTSRGISDLMTRRSVN